MKNVIKKLIVAGLALTLSVTSLFAAETIKCYGATIPSWADGVSTELVDQNTNGGTRTIKDVVVKNGVAFVNVEELAERYGYLCVNVPKSSKDKLLSLSTNQRQIEAGKDVYISVGFNYNNKTADSTYTLYPLNDEQPCIQLQKGAYQSGFKLEQSSEGYWYTGTEPEMIEYYTGTFSATEKPFLQNGKMYVPAKLFITLINNDAVTPVKYNADNNTIIFEDRLCAPIYKCTGYWFRKDGKVTEYNLDGTVKNVTQVEQRYIQ